MGRDIDVLGLECHGVEATLEDAEQLHLLKVLLLSSAGLDLVNQLHPRILVDGVDLEHVGADAAMLLRPQLSQSQHVLAVVVLVPTGETLET